MSSRQLDEEAIFHLARKIPEPLDRETYLDQICAGDQALRERVEALLKVHEKEASFLKSGGGIEPTADHSPITEGPGQQIGRYKLLQKIGEGGFGVVYMAEQERPVRRKVALKIIKPGMDTKAVVARFEAERQALALMDHPNIARVLDGGATKSGRPYFVMELVKGVPITEYCDENQLSTDERLKLFIDVCQAVQHAHQKGVIHRDLKPSNILVTLHDGHPVIKVIDFGVAKATNQRLTEKTLFTSYGEMIGTPQYMSPEQAEMSGLDVDTRSDIYSLGVVLYELLTGTTPLEAERLRTAGYAEMQRLIREEEPPKPSTRLSSSGEQLTIIARHRSISPEQLQKVVRGDLDWIVMKALEKDRGRRYVTPSSLMDDVQRFLSDQPVEARPPSSGYRLRKFARRNRALIATTSIVAAVLIAATGMSLWLALEMKLARDEMRIARDNAQARLEAYHTKLIENALLHAVMGDTKSVQEIISATGPEFPEDWRLTLKGVANLHNGRNEDAINELTAAVKENPENVSARAMLSLGYFHTGKWHIWYKHVRELRNAVPRPAYADFDNLFLAYAWFYINYGESETKLDEIVKKHRTWVFARTMRANAKAHRANAEGNKELMQSALKEVDDSTTMDPDNPFTLMVRFYVYSSAIRLPVDNYEELVPVAETLATQLAKQPEYVVGTLVRAVYYDFEGATDQAVEAWHDLLKYGDGMVIHWAAAGLLREGHVDEVREGTWNEPEARIARAYVLALSEDRLDREQAMDTYRNLLPDADTWFLRHLLIQIPLLCRDRTGIVEEQCKAWANGKKIDCVNEIELVGMQFIKYMATSNAGEIDLESSSKIERFFANFQTALLKYSSGEVEGAIEQLQKCENYGGAVFWWLWRQAFQRQFAMKIESEMNETD